MKYWKLRNAIAKEENKKQEKKQIKTYFGKGIDFGPNQNFKGECKQLRQPKTFLRNVRTENS